MSLFSSLIKSAGSDLGETVKNATGLFSGKSSVKGSVSSTASSASDINDDGKGWVTAPFQVRLGSDFTSRYAALSWLSPGVKLGDTLNAMKVGKLFIGDDEDRVNKLYGLDEEEGSELLRQHNYQDTRVGGNDAFNNVWAFGEDDDISRGIFTIDKDKGIGMGRVYASTTQQNQVIAWFTFGIPRFSSFSAFYKQAFDSNLISLNTQGFNPSILLGAIFDIAALSIEIPLLPIKWLSQQKLDRYKIGRFYELRACMHLYYKYVDSMLAQWLVSAGLYMNGSESDAGRDVFASPDDVPDALSDGASIWDIIQRKALNLGASNEKIRTHAGTFSNDPNEKDETKLWKISTRNTKDGITTLGETPMKGSIRKMEMEANRVATNGFGSSEDLTAQLFNRTGENDPTDSTSANNDELKAYLEKLKNIQEKSGSKLNAKSNASGANSVFDDNYGVSWGDKFEASMFGATQYVGFRIDRSVDASESFSNSTSPSEFAQTFNDGVRNANNQQLKSLLSGDTGIPIVDGLISQAKGIFQAANDLISSTTGIDFFSNLGSAVVSGAYLDIPEQYAGSDFGKSHSINLQLRSPYGDMISIYQSIIVPLSMVLAGCLPRAGGDNSYVQPFLCRVYCKGMFSVPMGIIDSVNIKRGSSEFGWTYQNLPTCVDVSISIKDMSPVMYMTMTDGIFTSIIAQDSAFKEYMLTLSGVGLWERLSTWHRWQRNITYIARNLRNVIGNPNYWSHSISQWQIVQTAAGIWPKSAVSNN